MRGIKPNHSKSAVMYPLKILTPKEVQRMSSTQLYRLATKLESQKMHLLTIASTLSHQMVSL